MVPFADLVLAVVRRTRRGPVAVLPPDKQHLHHRLLEIGHSQRRAVLIMWLWAGADRVRRRASLSLYREPLDLRSRIAAWAVADPGSLTVPSLPAASHRPARRRRVELPDAAQRTFRLSPRDLVLVFTSDLRQHSVATTRRRDGRHHDDRTSRPPSRPGALRTAFGAGLRCGSVRTSDARPAIRLRQAGRTPTHVPATDRITGKRPG